MVTGLYFYTSVISLSILTKHSTSLVLSKATLSAKNTSIKNLDLVSIYSHSPIITLPNKLDTSSFSLSRSYFSKITHSIFLSHSKFNVYQTQFDKISKDVVHFAKEDICANPKREVPKGPVSSPTCFFECVFDKGLILKKSVDVSFIKCTFNSRFRLIGSLGALSIDNCVFNQAKALITNPTVFSLTNTNITCGYVEITINNAQKPDFINYCYVTETTNKMMNIYVDTEIMGLMMQSKEANIALFAIYAECKITFKHSVFNFPTPYFEFPTDVSSHISLQNCCYSSPDTLETPWTTFNTVKQNINVVDSGLGDSCPKFVYVKRIDYEVRKNKKADLKSRIREVDWAKLFLQK